MNVHSSPVPDAFPYCGRFAPSPTGHLHFGSLIAALASCLEARAQGGRWLVRMEDVDAPRNTPGAAESILKTLEAYGFVWDGAVLWQSTRLEAYRAALERLRAQGLVFGCACSRKEIAAATHIRALDGSLRYPGTCRAGWPAGRTPRAWRFRVTDQPVSFMDAVQGAQEQNLAQETGDFVLLRADGLFAYQLAVVTDDADQGITHVVRGADLLDSTPRQIALQRALAVATPSYAHLPVVVDATGEKLSKQTLAPPLEIARAAENLVAALCFLGQCPPLGLRRARVTEVWDWAQKHWDFAAIPRCRQLLPDGVKKPCFLLHPS
ncbi:MAG: tRNA glutamyl-Q(34) synthetase GluQRS [Zoogloeaceae bacterium]|jgi:glutamyl-Q tRNA(Asp) synthetase|nr:tRNA glutamyl-Q(34) synthetase GluQRS [Zoogloeaceae bacterium]